MRAYRSTQPRLGYAQPIRPERTMTLRRISAAFKDVPDGQVLGPSLDYSHRLPRLDVLDGETAPGEETAASEAPPTAESEPAPAQYRPVAEWLREQDLLPATAPADDTAAADIPDLTREPVAFPAPRAQRLQALARLIDRELTLSPLAVDEAALSEVL